MQLVGRKKLPVLLWSRDRDGYLCQSLLTETTAFITYYLSLSLFFVERFILRPVSFVIMQNKNRPFLQPRPPAAYSSIKINWPGTKVGKPGWPLPPYSFASELKMTLPFTGGVPTSSSPRLTRAATVSPPSERRLTVTSFRSRSTWISSFSRSGFFRAG